MERKNLWGAMGWVITTLLLVFDVLPNWFALPKLEIQIQGIDFESKKQISDFLPRLEELEKKYGAIVGFRIERLKSHILEMDWDDRVEIKNFLRYIQKEIKFYDKELGGDDKTKQEPSNKKKTKDTEICLSNGIISWMDCEAKWGRKRVWDVTETTNVPDENSLKSCEKWKKIQLPIILKENEDSLDLALCDFYDIVNDPLPEIYFEEKLIEKVRQDPHLTEVDNILKKQANDLYNLNIGTENELKIVNEGHRDIARSLRAIRETVTRLFRGKGDKIIFTVRVLNKSSAPNTLLGKTSARVCLKELCKSYNLAFRFDKVIDEKSPVRHDITIDGSSSLVTELMSGALSNLQAESLHEIFPKNPTIEVEVQDVHNEVWKTKTKYRELIL